MEIDRRPTSIAPTYRSKFDTTTWRGVPIEALFDAAGVGNFDYALVSSYGGYTTNLPVTDLVDFDAMVAVEFDGAPLEAEHGGPVRLLVSHLYLWKSAKGLSEIRLGDDEDQGFWEAAGATTTTATHGQNSATPVTETTTIDRTPIRRRLAWREAIVVGSVAESTTARTLVLGIDGWTSHRPGQHLDVRLTAPDGYQLLLSYSLSSGPGEAPQITVERVEYLRGGRTVPCRRDRHRRVDRGAWPDRRLLPYGNPPRRRSC